jgi:hypothetical protein
MSVDSILREKAEHIAKDMLRTAEALRTELRGMERRKIEIDAQLNATKVAVKRLLDFKPQVDADFQCPRCWLYDETRSKLLTDTTSDNTLRCSVCGHNYILYDS